MLLHRILARCGRQSTCVVGGMGGDGAGDQLLRAVQTILPKRILRGILARRTDMMDMMDIYGYIDG